jgi:cytochrome c biogenesis protein CcdA
VSFIGSGWVLNAEGMAMPQQQAPSKDEGSSGGQFPGRDRLAVERDPWAGVRSGVLLVAVIAAGLAALVFFWNEVVGRDDFSAVSLVFVAALAGVAATFNPCALPALPAFLTFAGAGGATPERGRRTRSSLATALGAMSIVVVVGVIVGLAGAGTKSLIDPYFRWVQLGVGIFLIGVATFHLLGFTHRLTFVGPVMSFGSRVWDRATRQKTSGSSYLVGAGFVLVGVG